MNTNKNQSNSIDNLDHEVKLRKKAEEIARLAEQNYRTIFDNNNEAIAVHDITTGRILDCNETLLQMFRISKEQVLASKIIAFSSGQPPYDQENALKWIDRAIEKSPQQFEWFAKRYDNSCFWCEVTLKKLILGNEQCILAFVKDISKQKDVENELRRSEKKHREILEGLNDVAYRMSLPDGKYEYVSQAAKNVFGYEKNELLENPLLIQKIMHPQFIQYFQEKWTDLNKGIVPKTYEYKIIDPEGKERWIFQSNTAITDDQGNMIAIEGLCRDITEQKLSEERSEAALKEKETLLQEVHHRVKNNMQVINSLLNLQAINIEDEQTKSILKDSQSRVYAMSAVHETLHGSERLSEINLKSYLHKVASSILHSFATTKKKVDLIFDIKESPINLNQAYPLGLAINELITNSMKYAFLEDRPGEIFIGLNNLENELEIVVSDNGIGIPKDIDWKEGKTLGLNLVRNLIENQLNGSIELDTNKGTKYTIRFNLESNYRL